MASLSIVTGVCGAIDITKKWLDTTIGNCAMEHQLVVVSNGNTKDEEEQLDKWLDNTGWSYELIRSPYPLGSTRTFNEGVAEARGDIIAMLHNDLMVLDEGWDMKLLSFFKMIQPQYLGVVGFHGSKRLGHPEIYRIPYELVQLARGDNYSNMIDAEMHGNRAVRPVEVATLDGMSLIMYRELFRSLGGFDEAMIHHMYDHDLCMRAHYDQRHNYMLPIVVQHLNGQTANASRYNDAYESQGRDAGIHAQSHVYFYNKWRERLPVVVQ